MANPDNPENPEYQLPEGVFNADLIDKIQDAPCVERVVAELSDGTEIEAGLTRPDGLVAYRVEYRDDTTHNKSIQLAKAINYRGQKRTERFELADLEEPPTTLSNGMMSKLLGFGRKNHDSQE